MNTKHTPGPWESSRDAVPDHHVQITVYSQATGKRIATVFEAQANVPLITAAPELIHAVELAEAQLRKMGYECDCDNLPNQCPLCACSTAIAKAKGE